MHQTDDSSIATGRDHRVRVRDQAFARRSVHHHRPPRFETPAWLERSFVLPVAGDSSNQLPDGMPDQPRPHHDVLTVSPEPSSAFVRPPSEEIDFARVVRIADATRIARRALVAALALAVIALVLFWATGLTAVLTVATLAAGGAVGAGIRLAGLRSSTVPPLRY